MITFIHGVDTFRAKQRLKDLKKQFVKKEPRGAVVTLDATEKTFTDIQEALTAQTLFSNTKMVVVENALAAATSLQEKIMVLIKKGVPASHLVVFFEEEPDKRKALFKVLRKQNAEVFDSLKGAALERWVKERLRANGVGTDTAAVRALVWAVGDDLWRMQTEIDKLTGFVGTNGRIDARTVTAMVPPKINDEVFAMVDALGWGDKQTSLRLLHEQIALGKHHLIILSMVLYQFRNAVMTRDLLDRGVAHHMIAKKTGIHPYAAPKTIKQAQNMQSARLKKIYKKLVTLEHKFKRDETDPFTLLDTFFAML